MRSNAWATLAENLHLAAYEPSARYHVGVSFRQLARALGMPAGAPVESRHYLRGQRDGVEIILSTHDADPGDGRISRMRVAARVDPPLLLGMMLARRIPVEDASPLSLGEPVADFLLHLSGFDERPALLFSPADPEGRVLLHDVVDVAKGGWLLAASDSVVHFETHVGDGAGVVDRAVRLASRLAARRRSVPLTPDEQARRAEWQRFADGAGFVLDPQRMTLRGKAGAAEMDIALETDGRRVRTSVAVAFPRNLDMALFVQRTTAPGFLQRLLSHDIRVGDAEFDAMFEVTGHPVEAVRAALARPALLGVLKRLGEATTSVQMNGAELYFRVEGPIGEPTLAEILSLAQTASASLFDEVEQVGPYR